MHITVVTPAFNVAPYLADAVRSVLAQTHQDWSMTIVDDGSTDTTAAVAASFGDPRIRLIRQDNAGVSAARNRGVAAAQPCDAVLFLDGDDWLAPFAMTDLARTLAQHPHAVAASGRYARIAADGSARHSARPPRGNILNQLLVRNLFANGGHVLVAATALAPAGPFRTSLHYGEDWEFWTRLAALGDFAATRTRAPLLYVREHASSACHTYAINPASYARALDAIHAEHLFGTQVGSRRRAALRRAADAEAAWAVGRALIRHGRDGEAWRWMRRSVAARPTIRRLCLLAILSCGIPVFSCSPRVAIMP